MADHIIEVKLKPNGTPMCAPNVVAGVRAGDRLVWIGLRHVGKFEGRIVDPTPQHRAGLRLNGVQPDPTKIPTSWAKWKWGEMMTLRKDLEPGVYKYSVTVGGKTIDPIVVTEA